MMTPEEKAELERLADTPMHAITTADFARYTELLALVMIEAHAQAVREGGDET